MVEGKGDRRNERVLIGYRLQQLLTESPHKVVGDCS